MKLAVISDIHSNMDALKRVLEDIKSNRIDDIVSLGDNIGYGPEPEEVIQAVTAHGVISLCGNHEMAVKKRVFAENFNPSAKKAIDYTIEKLSETSTQLIHQYPLYLKKDKCYFVHGFPPDSVFEYLFMVSNDMILKTLQTIESQICFVGHTHTLELIELRDNKLKRIQLSEGIFKLEENNRYIVNTGSVGQPRDKNKCAKYVIYDSDEHCLEIRFIKYDQGLTIQKMKQAELPWQIAMNLV